MKKRLISLLLVLSLALGSAMALVSCDDSEKETESSDVETKEPVTESDTDAPTDEGESEMTESNSETDTDQVTESDVETDTETESESVVESESESETDTETEEDTDCVHPYDATIEGHWKPACDVCGKGVGKMQDHEFEERVEDEGDLLIYAFRCTVCKFRAYEQEVPYEINSFYSAGDLSYTDTSGNLSGSFGFESGIGYAAFSGENGGSAVVIVASNGEIGDPSGRYLVMKVRAPKSQSGFTAAIKSMHADSYYTMAFTGIGSGWVTIIVDVTKAIGTRTDTDNTEKLTGYQPDMSGEYYLDGLRINVRADAGESFDIAYVMMCDTIEDAQSFVEADGAKTVITYDDIVNKAPETDKKQCVDENGNPIIHEYIINADGTHTLKETCYQCGLTAVENEPHSFTQTVIDDDYTYACAACGCLQFGININKYISAEQINSAAATYYKITKNGVFTDEASGNAYASFAGQGTTAQILFARNSSVSSSAEEAGAFAVGKANYFIIKMRTTAPAVSFGIQIGTSDDGVTNFRFPTAVSTANEWAVYVVDLAAVMPGTYVPDDKGNYTITQFYYHIGGADFSADVVYDIQYNAFVDSWDEVVALVEDETIINVTAANSGSIVATKDRSCVGEHSYVIDSSDGKYKVICASCGDILKEYEVSGLDAFYPAEVLSSIAAMNGTVNIDLKYDENGMGYVHLDNMVTNGPSGGNWMGWNVIRTSAGVNTGRFIVIKLRIGENGLSQNYLKFYTGTKSGVVSEGQAISVKVSEDGQWHTIVVDMYTRIADPATYMIPDANGRFDIKELQIRPFSHTQTAAQADDWMDIAYIAFCDELADLAGFVEEEQYEWSTSVTESILRDTASGGTDELPEIEVDPNLPVTSEHNITETSKTEDDGSVTYTYTCTHCEMNVSKTVSEKLCTYFSIKETATEAGTYYQLASNPAKIEYDDNTVFARFVGADAIGQAIWLRVQEDMDKDNKTGDQFLDKSLDIGQSKYFIIRARTNTPTQSFIIYISTTGKSSPTAVSVDGTEGKYNISGGELAEGDTYATRTGYEGITIPMNVADTNEWKTYVIDLSEVIPEYFVKDSETQTYVLDTFFYHLVGFKATTSIDVEYMAFVENWDDVNTVVEDDTVVSVKNAGGSYAVIDTETQNCVEHNGISSVDPETGSYIISCAGCGEKVTDYGVLADSVNHFIPADALMGTEVQNGTSINKAFGVDEDGTAFVRLNNLKTNTNNWAALNPIVRDAGVTGQYMIIKLRIGENGLSQTKLSFYIISTASGKTWDKGLVSVKVTEDNGWHTIVVDLASRVANEAFTASDDGYHTSYLQIRPFTGAQTNAQEDDYMDISYIAFCDSLDDIKNIVAEESYEWSISDTDSQIRDSETNGCVNHIVVETVSGNTYSYSCSACNNTLDSITVPESVKKYYSANQIGTGAVVYYNVNGGNNIKCAINFGDEAYATVNGTNGQDSQILWARAQEDFKAKTGDVDDKEYSVGGADKLVVRARTNSSSRVLKICISTTGKNGDGGFTPASDNGTPDDLSDDTSAVYPTTFGFIEISVPLSTVGVDGWATYVIDLAEVASEYYVAVEDEYVIDTFYLQMDGFAAEETVDIAYIALVEGDWAEIDGLVEETEVINVTNADGSYTKVNVADGSSVTEE